MTQSKVPGPNLGSVTITGTVTEKQDQQAAVATTWTSATALNTTTATYAVTGYGTINVGVLVPTTTTAGAVTIEGTQNGTDWTPLGASRQDNSAAENPVPLAYLVGTNGFRIYAASVEAFTQVRVKLTTAIVGAGNVVVTITGVAGGVEPIVATRARKVATYRAVYRLAARPYRLINTYGAAGRKQWATIHHAAAAVKTVKIRYVGISFDAISAVSQVWADLVRITTAPATGNPAITPSRSDTADTVAEATCLALPTTAATETTDIYGTAYWNVGASTTASTAIPPPIAPMITIYQPNPGDDEAKLPTIRAGVLEGWTVNVDVNAAETVAGWVLIEFTEESA